MSIDDMYSPAVTSADPQQFDLWLQSQSRDVFARHHVVNIKTLADPQRIEVYIVIIEHLPNLHCCVRTY